MDDFAKWFDQVGRGSAPDVPPVLEGYECDDADGGYRYPCHICGEEQDIFCDPEDFDPLNHYCRRSERCCL